MRTSRESAHRRNKIQSTITELIVMETTSDYVGYEYCLRLRENDAYQEKVSAPGEDVKEEGTKLEDTNI